MYKKGMAISDVLAEIVSRRELTQEEAAREMGVQQSYVSRWISGNGTPSDKYVPHIVKFTGLGEAKVLEAIHVQRRTKASAATRIAALEERVGGLEEQLQEALALLREVRRRGR